MKVYLKKINQKPLVLSEDELNKFTTGLSESDTVYLQNLTNSEQTKIEITSFNESFNNYLDNFLQNKDCNILIIYQIKLNYYIINVIKVQEDEYNSLQFDNKWIDTNDNNDAKYLELIKNSEVLKLAFKEYLGFAVHGKNESYTNGTINSYINVIEQLNTKKKISIF